MESVGPKPLQDFCLFLSGCAAWLGDSRKSWFPEERPDLEGDHLLVLSILVNPK